MSSFSMRVFPLLTLDILLTNWAALCWSVDSCLSGWQKIQELITQYQISHGKHASWLWEAPPCISQVAWFCMNHPPFIMEIFWVLLPSVSVHRPSLWKNNWDNLTAWKFVLACDFRGFSPELLDPSAFWPVVRQIMVRDQLRRKSSHPRVL